MEKFSLAHFYWAVGLLMGELKKSESMEILKKRGLSDQEIEALKRGLIPVARSAYRKQKDEHVRTD